jgi:hypothetical protein
MRRAERALVVVLVLAAHGLLGWAWRFAAAPPARSAPSPEPTRVVWRLIAPAPQAELPAPPPAAPLRAAVPARMPVRPNAAAAPDRAPTVTNPPGAITLVAPQPTSPAASAPALRLELPRGRPVAEADAMKRQALEDPRSNSPPPSLDSRVAAVAGTPAWTEERMDAARARFRIRGQCIEVHRARNTDLDPWNQNHSPTPKVAKPEC